jgi:cephalosporin hydroxylase
VSLWADFLTNDGRLIHKWAHYFPVYERHFARFRNQPVTMLEIGVGQGGSLQMWKRYLGPFAQIIGMEIRAAAKDYEEDQIHVRIGDQGDPSFLAGVVREFGPFDIVLDDGSHRMDHIHASFKALYPAVRHNGVYLVEDLHTAYSERFGGGYKNPASFIETCKDLVDQVNGDYTGDPALRTSDFARSTLSMHFYDSIVVFERGRHLPKHAPKTGHDENDV